MDGPSIVEDDGGLGILAVLHYYAQIPQANRPKSIIVYFESRHFVPGTEASYPFEIVKQRPRYAAMLAEFPAARAEYASVTYMATSALESN